MIPISQICTTVLTKERYFYENSVCFKIIEEQTYNAPGVDGIITKAFKV